MYIAKLISHLREHPKYKNIIDVHVQEKYQVSFDKDIIFQRLDNTCRIWLIDSEGPLLMCL